MEVNPIGICFLFKDQKIKYVNKAFLDIMEKKRKNVLNKNIFEIFPGQKLDKYLNKTKLENSSNSIKVEIEATNKWVDIRFIETNFNNKKLNALILIDITKSIKQKKEIEYLSYKDKLTDLYNRRFFEEEMERLDTERQLPISVIMADLNGLKLINDSYGHEKGDEVLIKTAEILKETLREEDIVARQGGDEFAILLPKTNSEQLNIIIKRIRDKIEDINSKEDLPLSIALGSATKEKQIEDINEVLKKADNNMYQNKLSESRSSKNKIVKSILNSLSAKSNETTDHAKRMKKLAIRFGSKLKLTYAEINRLSLLASMHDIGKTTISKAILTKADKLSEKEWEIMKNHSKQGYKIASASEEFILIAEDILAHHEHWDGSGYPVGLKGKEIPYLARIISIIDSYDVMTNERPYSKAISKEEALEEIKRCAGSQFDPKLTEDFIDMMNANKN
nr:diguanylate cyclase [Halanaerobium polyolivorans]